MLFCFSICLLIIQLLDILTLLICFSLHQLYFPFHFFLSAHILANIQTTFCTTVKEDENQSIKVPIKDHATHKSRADERVLILNVFSIWNLAICFPICRLHACHFGHALLHQTGSLPWLSLAEGVSLK